MSENLHVVRDSSRFEMVSKLESGNHYGDIMSFPPPPPPAMLSSNVIRINICDDDSVDATTKANMERKPSQLNREAKLKKQENLLSWKKKEKESMMISPAAGAVSNAGRQMRTFRPFTDYLPPTAKSNASEEEQDQIVHSRTSSDNKTVMLKSATTDYSKDYTSSSSSSSWEDDGNQNASNQVKTTTTTISTFKHASSYNNSSLDDENGSTTKLSAEGSSSNAVLVVPLDMKKKRDESSIKRNNLDVRTTPTTTTGSSSLGPSLSFDSTDENKENGVYSSSELNIDCNNKESIKDPGPYSGPQLDLSIFDLLDKNSKKFVLKPAPLGLTIRCQIYRQKGLYPKYRFYLENVDSNLLLLMTARKKKKTKTSCYVISTLTYDLENVEKYIETPVAKLKSNLLGTHFSLYDFGVKPPPIAIMPSTPMSVSKKLSRSASFFRASFAGSSTNLASSLKVTRSYNNSSEVSMDMNGDDLHSSAPLQTNSHFNSIDQDLCRKEYLSIFYELNMLGFKGPRQMSIIVPGMDNNYNREDFLLRTPHDSLDDAWKQIEASLRQPAPSSDSAQSRKNSTNSSPGHQNHVPVIIKKANSIDAPNEPINNNLLSISSSNRKTSRSRLHSIKRSLFQLGQSSQSSEGKSTDLTRQISTGSNLEVNGSSSVSASPAGSQITNTSPTESSCSSNGLNASRGSCNNHKLPNVVKLINKPPDWHPELRSFALDFNGRVTVSSSKNFQVVHEANTGYVVMQFGKVNRDLFTCDFSYPFCALQAFGIALTSLEDKLGCD